MTTKYLTTAALELFYELWNEREDWNGTPLFSGTPAQKGLLTSLKRAGLLTTEVDDDSGRTDFSGRRIPPAVFVYFTEAGLKLGGERDAEGGAL